MMFLTSDQHFGHENIIKYCNRPFTDAEEMDQALVDSWNMVVDRNDTVICHGDFTFGNARTFTYYCFLLNGTIIFLSNPWHHDSRWIRGCRTSRTAHSVPFAIGPQKMYIINGVKTRTRESVYLAPSTVVLGSPLYKVGGRTLAITLSHFPYAEWPRKHHGAVHFHGHSHGNHKVDNERILDIGVDTHGFEPVSLFWAVDEVKDLGDSEKKICKGSER